MAGSCRLYRASATGPARQPQAILIRPYQTGLVSNVTNPVHTPRPSTIMGGPKTLTVRNLCRSTKWTTACPASWYTVAMTDDFRGMAARLGLCAQCNPPPAQVGLATC